MTEKETEDQLVRDALFEAIEKDAFYVDLDEEIDFPEIAISYGEHEYWKTDTNRMEASKTYPTPCFNLW